MHNNACAIGLKVSMTIGCGMSQNKNKAYTQIQFKISQKGYKCYLKSIHTVGKKTFRKNDSGIRNSSTESKEYILKHFLMFL
jgi:hypothetical protein